MFHDSEIVLRATGGNDFLPALAVVCFLVLMAALLNSNTIWLISVIFLLIFFSYYCYRRYGNGLGAISTTFRTNTNGDLLLERQSAPAIAGKLSGSQWCSRHMAVLRYKSLGRVGHLIILKMKQRPEQFRQLSVWLRHNSRNEGRREP